jgi:hypothetical protein
MQQAREEEQTIQDSHHDVPWQDPQVSHVSAAFAALSVANCVLPSSAAFYSLEDAHQAHDVCQVIVRDASSSQLVCMQPVEHAQVVVQAVANPVLLQAAIEQHTC